jgi:hypothetical protein
MKRPWSMGFGGKSWTGRFLLTTAMNAPQAAAAWALLLPVLVLAS